MTGILMMSVGNSYGYKPVNTVAPVVSGTAQAGQTLSTTTGTWDAAPAAISYTYQWQRNTSDIGGATSSTYLLQSADVGNTVRCVVTATNAVGATSANSNSTGTVIAAPTFLNVTNTTGATVTTSGNYKIAVYNGSGQFGVASVGSGSAESNTIEYLVVAGGGGGFSYGGGGAGGLLANGTNNQAVTAQTYTITVGAGGGAGAATNSSIGSLVVATRGGSRRNSNGDGGSGAGAEGSTSGFESGWPGTSGQGNNGGGAEQVTSSNKSFLYAGGGGGGRGSAGGVGFRDFQQGRLFGGAGGSGFTSTITGSSATYAGGGGGAAQSSNNPYPGTGGAGGSGGGGAGTGVQGASGSNGSANTGGGGGAPIGLGGSGRVIIKWRFQ